MKEYTRQSRRCYRGAAEPLTERHVQAIWYDRDLRPANLVTREGEVVSVIHPGEWNPGSGPDFRNAVLEVGEYRRRLIGDVEVHLAPSDWEAHGHGGDRAYDNVVAHVTWLCGPSPATLPEDAVTICLGKAMAANAGFSPEQVDLTAYPYAKFPSADRPCFRHIGGDPQFAAEILGAAGEHRMQVKARRLRAILAARPGEREQIFYEEVMNALGYKKNSRGFRKVAGAVPLSVIEAEPDNAEMAMLAAGGFIDWDMDGVRPWNSPERRLKSAAQLFASAGVMYMADVTSFERADVRMMVRSLTGLGLMGRGRAAAVIANVILPFALAEGRAAGAPVWLPPEDLSLPVKLTAFRLFGRDHNPAAFYATNGLHVQGLIQIHRDFCLQVHPDCECCALAHDLEVAAGGAGRAAAAR